MEALGKTVVALVKLAFFIILRAKIFQDMWSWFVVTNFNQKEISLMQSAGLCVMILLFKAIPSKKEIEELDDDQVFNTITSVATMIIIWFIGYVIHLMGV